MSEADIYIAAVQTFLIALGVCVVLGLAFLAGRWQDVYWRYKQKRNMEKKDYYALDMVSQDSKEVQPIIVNAKNSAFIHQKGLWVAANNRIYRIADTVVAQENNVKEDKDGNIVITLKKVNKSDGFSFEALDTKQKMKGKLGIPTIAVSGLSFKPIDYKFVEGESLRPQEVHGALNTYVLNELAAEKKPNEDITMYAAVFACLFAVAAAYFGFVNNGALNDLTKTAGGMVADLGKIVAQMVVK